MRSSDQIAKCSKRARDSDMLFKRLVEIERGSTVTQSSERSSKQTLREKNKLAEREEQVICVLRFRLTRIRVRQRLSLLPSLTFSSEQLAPFSQLLKLL